MAETSTNIASPDGANNVPLDKKILGVTKRRYIPAEKIEQLAADKYNKTSSGITFADLTKHFGLTKYQAQRTIKHARDVKALYTCDESKPQKYLPVCMQAAIDRKRLENVLDVLSGGTYPDKDVVRLFQQKSAMAYVQLLRAAFADAPLCIHKLQLKCTISAEAYNELEIKPDQCNKAKTHRENIGKTQVRYHINCTGTVVIHIACTNQPFRLAGQSDVTELFVFIGQIRDRLALLLHDTRETLLQDVLSWVLQRCDINKDAPLNFELSLPAINLQLRHADETFRLYVKPMGAQMVLRAEEALTPNKLLRESIRELLMRYNTHPLLPAASALLPPLIQFL